MQHRREHVPRLFMFDNQPLQCQSCILQVFYGVDTMLLRTGYTMVLYTSPTEAGCSQQELLQAVLSCCLQRYTVYSIVDG